MKRGRDSFKNAFGKKVTFGVRRSRSRSRARSTSRRPTAVKQTPRARAKAKAATKKAVKYMRGKIRPSKPKTTGTELALYRGSTTDMRPSNAIQTSTMPTAITVPQNLSLVNAPSQKAIIKAYYDGPKDLALPPKKPRKSKWKEAVKVAKKVGNVTEKIVETSAHVTNKVSGAIAPFLDAAAIADPALVPEALAMHKLQAASGFIETTTKGLDRAIKGDSDAAEKHYTDSGKYQKLMKSLNAPDAQYQHHNKLNLISGGPMEVETID